MLWMAGFFDGEGSVSVYRTWRRGSGGMRRKTEHLGLYVSISQNVREPLDFIRARWGGSVYPTAHKPRSMWAWRACGSRAKQFLTAVLPYLQVKQTDARRGLHLELSAKQLERKQPL